MPARPQKRIGRMDDDERVAGVRQERHGLVLDEPIGFPGEDAHRGNLVDGRAQLALGVVLRQVDLHGQDLPAGVGMRLDRVAVEVGVKHRPRMHRNRPPFAASPRADAEPLVQLLPQRGRDFGRFQHPPHDAPELAALLRSWIASLVVERVFPPRSVPIQSGKAVDVGKALQRGGRKSRSGRSRESESAGRAYETPRH